MYPLRRFLARNSSRAACSLANNGYTLQSHGLNPSLRSIAWSQDQLLEKHSAFAFSKTPLRSIKYSGTICSKVLGSCSGASS